MRAMDLHDIRFIVKSQITNAIYDAKYNVSCAWVNGEITREQCDRVCDQLGNALTIATVAINNAENQAEIDDVVAELEQYLQKIVQQQNLPCRF